MTALPPIGNFTDQYVTEGGFKTALTNLRAYLNELFGSDGAAATAKATLGIPASSSFGFRNKLINGDFSIWQRGTSFVNSNAYTADRWKSDGATNTTFSRVARVTGDGASYRMRIAATNASNGHTFLQALEADVVNAMKGKTVLLSFYIDGSFTGNVAVGIQKSATADTASTGFSAIAQTSMVPTSTPTRYTLTAAIPDDGSANSLRVYFSVINMTNGAVYDLQRIQLEEGSIATPFEMRQPGTELQLCQRYYYRCALASGQHYGAAGNESTSTALVAVQFPVPMRTAPTALEQSGVAGDYSVRAAGVTTACTSVPTFSAANTALAVSTFTTGATLTNGHGGSGRSNGANSYLGWSAEL